MSEANDITAALLEKIPARYPHIRLWRNNRIKALATGRNAKQRMVSAGVDGQADLSGIIGHSGRRLEIEVKAGRDRLRLAQRQFGRMIQGLGGAYVIARGVEQGLQALDETLHEDERQPGGLQSAAEIIAQANGAEAFLRQQQTGKNTPTQNPPAEVYHER